MIISTNKKGARINIPPRFKIQYPMKKPTQRYKTSRCIKSFLSKNFNKQLLFRRFKKFV